VVYSETVEILFVCGANRCRSVVAEHLFRQFLLAADEKLAAKVSISSAGIVPREMIRRMKSRGRTISRPFFGRLPNEAVVAAMAKKGIDISGYRSRGVNRPVVEKADLIIIVAQEVFRQALLSLCPSAESRVLTFGEFSGKQGYYLFDDYDTAPRELYGWDWCEDPKHATAFIAEMEQHLAEVMPQFLERMRTGSTEWARQRAK
jgi:protein-tyrosine-phosphatase